MTDVAAYLERIDYAGPTRPDLSTLQALHLAHLYTVPFENLDIHVGCPIVLDEERLFAKIVTNHRGGFCYELNSMFAWLLRSLGFDVDYLSARVARDDGTFTREFDHLTLHVRTPEEPSTGWLTDVGFGDSFLTPLPLQPERGRTHDGRAEYWVEPDDTELVLWRSDAQRNAAPQYRFALRPWTMEDFAACCHYNQTSPESHFTQKRICTLATPDGRISLTDSALITTVNGQRTEQPVRTESERTALLRDYFGVTLAECN